MKVLKWTVYTHLEKERNKSKQKPALATYTLFHCLDTWMTFIRVALIYHIYNCSRSRFKKKTHFKRQVCQTAYLLNFLVPQIFASRRADSGTH